MTTDPGDLVLDPTCGSGTTAYVAEQWGRRWITIDTSRVPLALARQRLLTATFPYYELQDRDRGPAGGFIYERQQNKKGEEVGGIVPHVTLKSIANDEPPAEEVLVDRPEVDSKITRVTGPFVVEATIPTPVDMRRQTAPRIRACRDDEGYVDRMLEVLRRNPVLQLGREHIGHAAVTSSRRRKSLYLSAEAMPRPAMSSSGGVRLRAGERRDQREAGLRGAARGAHEALRPPLRHRLRNPAQRPRADRAKRRRWRRSRPPTSRRRRTCDGRPAQDDALKPDLLRLRPPRRRGPQARQRRQVARSATRSSCSGLDIFDPTTFEVDHRAGDDVPAWFLDTDWNGLCFHVSQAFFPRTGAWDNLKKALKGEYDDSVWDHLAGTTSAPFTAGEHTQIAVKVIDDRATSCWSSRVLTGESRHDERASRSRNRSSTARSTSPRPSTGRSRRGRSRSACRVAVQRATSTATRRRHRPSPAQPARGAWQELELVNLIRERLDQWRELTAIRARRGRRWSCSSDWTARAAASPALLRPARGRRDDHLPARRRARDLLRGSTSPRRPRTCQKAGSTPFRRYACKMATGSGKTTVMGMLAAWSILNKVNARGDARFSDVVLVVCPNVTIRGRLGELDPSQGEASIYRTRDLVPPDLMTSAHDGAGCWSRTGTSSSARG